MTSSRSSSPLTSLAAFAAFAITSGAVLAQEGTPCPDSIAPSDWAQIQGLRQDHLHRFEADGARHVARMPRHGFDLSVEAGTATVRPLAGGWTWSLKLVSIDRGEASRTFAEGEATPDTNELHVRWDDDVTEWYVNGTGGLEHGFTLARRPHAATRNSAPLRIRMEVGGTAETEVDADGLGIDAADASGAKVLDYDGLVVLDADGERVDAHLEMRDGALEIVVDDAGAAYPLTVDPTIQTAFLKANLGDPNDAFGSAIAISGDTIVVGAPGERSVVVGNPNNNSQFFAGAAYVFQNGPGGWAQTGYLKANNAAAGQQQEFGTAVDVFGDRIVVGARREGSFSGVVNGPLTLGQPASSAQGFQSGAAYVFRLEGGAWVAESILKPQAVPLGRAAFGWSVAIHEQRIVVGAPEDPAATFRGGAAYVFARTGNNWAQDALLTAPNVTTLDRFGESVDIHLDTVIVGAPSESGDAQGVSTTPAFDDDLFSSGAAYTYTFDGTGWGFENYLKASNADESDGFGGEVDLTGDRCIVGAVGEDSNGSSAADNSLSNSGAAYVFDRVGSLWVETAYLKASNPDVQDLFGGRVAIDGPRAIVGSIGEDSLPGAGNGGPLANPASNAGAAYLFALQNGGWDEMMLVKADNAEALDGFGSDVDIDGTTAVVGASNESSVPSGAGSNPLDNSSSGSGAAYVLDAQVFPITHCTSTPNSTGLTAALGWSGSLVVADNDFTLEASQMPSFQFGMFVVSRNAGQAPAVNGIICLGAGTGRFDGPGQILNSGAAGAFSLDVDLTMVPEAAMVSSVLACETWYFQTWFRDTVGAGADFSDGLQVMFF